MENTLLKELQRLNKNEKLLLVEALWDSIVSDPDQLEIPEHHKSILKERLKTFETDKTEGSSWDEVKKKYA